MPEEKSWWPTYATRSEAHPFEAPRFSESIAAFLRAEVIGQDQVIRSLVRTLTISRLRTRVMSRPLGLFLFLGPTGVGKSQMTRRLAELFYGERSRILHIACTPELGAEAFVQAVLPSVGFRQEEDGLVGDVEQVLVLENAEKASAAFLTMLNHLVDLGQLGVQYQQTLMFARTCFILESRACSERIEQMTQSSVGFQPHQSDATREAMEQKVLAAAATCACDALGVDLSQRLDGILVFKPLKRDCLPALLEKLAQDVSRQLARCGLVDILIEIEDSARAMLLEAAMDRIDEGGWALRKLVREHLTYPVVDMALSGQLQGPAMVCIAEAEGRLQFAIANAT